MKHSKLFIALISLFLNSFLINAQIQTGVFRAISGYFKDGIKTEKVEVTNENGWADYVFNENYELKSLKDLEIFIHKNKHLPEIPTTEEVLENGVEFGELNAKLLQKIEELTLYTIAQEKEIKDQAAKIEELELLNNKFIELQSRLENLESK